MRPSATSVLRRFGAGLAVGATVVGTTAAGMLAASAAVATTPPDSHYTVSINQGNVPATAPGFSGHSCDEFGNKAATDDGWLFVASPDDFTSFEAVFDKGTVFYNDPSGQTSAAGTTVAFPKPNEHLAVTTPAGWTLQNAYANLADSKGGADTKGFFTLSHTCAATDQPPATSPAPTASFTNDCESGGIVVTLGNTDGTAPAHFTVTCPGRRQPAGQRPGRRGHQRFRDRRCRGPRRFADHAHLGAQLQQ